MSQLEVTGLYKAFGAHQVLAGADLAVPAGSLTRRPSPWLRGLNELPVRFTPVPVL